MASRTLEVTLVSDASKFGKGFKQAQQQTRQFDRQTSRTARQGGPAKLQNRIDAIGATAKFAIAGAATAAVTGFAKDSARSFLQFDDAMNQSIAIMGDVSDTLRDEMAEAAREVGKTTRLSAKDAAESYFFLASAGLDAAQSVAAMPQVAAFAQAGMFDMATATDLATDAQSALGLTVEDAQQNLENLTRVTDVFVQANNLANTSVEQIAQAMTNKVGAAARALGLDIEEIAAVLAAFADQGVKGAEAGTQLNIVLRDLQTKALENRDAFKEAGVAVFDSQGEFRNMADILGDLEGRLSGMSDAARKAELSTLGFSDKSVSALVTLLGTSEAIREYEEELRAASGTTQEIADKQLESFQGKLDLTKGAIDDLKISIGEGLLPVIADLTEDVTLLIGPLSDVISLWSDFRRNNEQLAESGNPFEAFLGDLVGQLNRGAIPAFISNMQRLNGLFGDTEPEVDATVSELTELERRARESGAATDDLGSGLESVNAGMARVQFEKAIGGFKEIGEKAKTAGERLAGFNEAFLTAVDPAFAALRAEGNLVQALEDRETLIAEGEASQEEVEEATRRVAEAQAEVNATAARLPDDLAPGERVFENLLAQAGLLQEEIEAAGDTFESLDGKKITLLAEIQLLESRSAFERNIGLPTFSGSTGANTTSSTQNNTFNIQGDTSTEDIQRELLLNNLSRIAEVG